MSSLVYSTDQGKICPECRNAIANCVCSKTQTYETQETIKVFLETKGRKGKGVTIIEGLGGTEAELKKTAKTLKQKCNCGGSTKNGLVEIQGDQRQIIKAYLEAQGIKVKISGA